jgi:hypothetical protein
MELEVVERVVMQRLAIGVEREARNDPDVHPARAAIQPLAARTPMHDQFRDVAAEQLVRRPGFSKRVAQEN